MYTHRHMYVGGLRGLQVLRGLARHAKVTDDASFGADHAHWARVPEGDREFQGYGCRLCTKHIGDLQHTCMVYTSLRVCFFESGPLNSLLSLSSTTNVIYTQLYIYIYTHR